MNASRFLTLSLSLLFAAAMGCGTNSYESTPDGGDSTEADGGNTNGDANNTNPDCNGDNGHHHGDCGHHGNDAGNTGNDAGNAGNDAGNTGNDAGNTGNDAGNTGNDAGNTGNDAGNIEPPCPNGMLSTPNGCECPDGQILWNNDKCVPETCPNGSVRQPDGSCQPPCGNNGVLLADGSCIPSGGLKFQFLIGSSSILYWHTKNGDDDQNVSGYFEKTVLPAEFPLVFGIYVFPGGPDPTLQVNVVLPMNYLSLPEAEQRWYMGDFCPTWNGSVAPADYVPDDYALCGEGSGWDIYLPRIWAQFPLE